MNHGEFDEYTEKHRILTYAFFLAFMGFLIPLRGQKYVIHHLQVGEICETLSSNLNQGEVYDSLSILQSMATTPGSAPT